VSLFGDSGDLASEMSYVAVPRWSERDQLQNEKLALGFYLSGHPFRSHERELRDFIKRGWMSSRRSRIPSCLPGSFTARASR